VTDPNDGSVFFGLFRPTGQFDETGLSGFEFLISSTTGTFSANDQYLISGESTEQATSLGAELGSVTDLSGTPFSFAIQHNLSGGENFTFILTNQVTSVTSTLCWGANCPPGSISTGILNGIPPIRDYNGIQVQVRAQDVVGSSSAVTIASFSGPEVTGAAFFDEVVTPASPGTIFAFDKGRRGQWLMGDKLDLVLNEWELTGTVTLSRPDAELSDRTKVRLAVDFVRDPNLPALLVHTHTPDQQACIAAVNAGAARIAAAQGKVAVSCVRDWARQRLDKVALPGQDADPQACLANDVKRIVQKRFAELATRESARCDPTDPPRFAYRTGAVAGPAARDGALALTADVLGADLATSVQLADSDVQGARCQPDALRHTHRVYDRLWKLARKAERRALRGRHRLVGNTADPVETILELQAEVEAFLTGNAPGLASLGRRQARLRARVSASCEDAPPVASRADLFPGACGATADWDAFSTCLIERARCRFCESFNAIELAIVDCDLFDDAQSNTSCP